MTNVQERTVELINSSAGGAFDSTAFDPGAFDVYTVGGGGLTRTVELISLLFMAMAMVGG